MTQEQVFRRYVGDALVRSEKLITEALSGVVDQLQADADKSLSSRDRQHLSDLAYTLRRNSQVVVDGFVREMESSLDAELSKLFGRRPARTVIDAPKVKKVDIELALVDEETLQEDIELTQLIHKIESEAEWEIRDLTSRMSNLTGLEEARKDHNPLRPEIFGRSMQRAIAQGGFDPSARMDLLRSLGSALSSALKETYRLYNDQLEAQDIRPIGPSQRAAGQSTTHRGSLGGRLAGSSGYGDAMASVAGSLDQPGMRAATAARDMSESLTAEAIGRLFRGESLQGLAWESGFGALLGGGNSASGGLSGAMAPGSLGPAGGGGRQVFPVNPNLQAALDRVNGLGFLAGGLIAEGVGGVDGERGGAALGTPVNLIAQFREELVAASSRPLEKLTIDVVAMMFDHILADRRLHPEAKASLGRLQIPVLRIALQDPSLFSNRSHPTRRLINRVASYSAGFEARGKTAGEQPAADTGRLREFLDAVDRSVEVIVAADEADAALFETELETIERVISDQSQQQQKEASEAVAALERAEFRTLLRRHLSTQIDRLLSNVEVDDFVRTFLREQWMTVLVECVVLHGESAPQTQEMKQTGSDLLWSVQPKVDKADRAHLIYLLPRMIKALQTGLNMIEWDVAARQEFFSQLMHAHTLVVRASGHTTTVVGDLQALKSRWEKAFDGSLRRTGDLLGLDVDIAVLEKERSAAGLIDASDVASRPRRPVRASAGQGPAAGGSVQKKGVQPADQTGEATVIAEQDALQEAKDAEADAELDASGMPMDAAGVRRWVDELRVGAWLRMRLQGQWANAQLIWCSPQGLFYMFSSNVGGRAHSMTRRGLEKLCMERGVQGLEGDSLVDRAVDQVMKRTQQPKAA